MFAIVKFRNFHYSFLNIRPTLRKSVTYFLVIILGVLNIDAVKSLITEFGVLLDVQSIEDVALHVLVTAMDKVAADAILNVNVWNVDVFGHLRGGL